MMSRLAVRALVLVSLALAFSTAVSAQPAPPQAKDPGVVPDDMLTLVVATHFVPSPAGDDAPSAHTLFTRARIPLSAFNDTDHCIDQAALEVAREYFTALGRLLGKASHYYFLPDDAVARSATMCERLHDKPPQAWKASKSKIIAVGRVVPSGEAPALEESLR